MNPQSKRSGSRNMLHFSFLTIQQSFWESFNFLKNVIYLFFPITVVLYGELGFLFMAIWLKEYFIMFLY